MTDSLDDLFSSAKAIIRVDQAAKAAAAKLPRRAPVKEDTAQTSLFYSDPANWERVRGVALIHEETGTLLGNFSEYRHLKEPGTTRLLREPALIPVSGTLTVSGSWWLTPAKRPEAAKPWHEKRMAIIHLHLGELRLHAPACEVNVFLEYGAIARVELAVDTMLAAEEGQPEQLLMLPAGTNVREVTSLDCKMALRKELGI